MTTKYKAKTEGKERVAMTEAEVAEHAIHVQTATEADEAWRTTKAQRVTDKANAISKLEALGLTSSEIDALSK
jgi:hypothetical protein|tara:strand:- start:28 stop:246 length:219 start_codon:yes stop_codon:yes gene_type:complete